MDKVGADRPPVIYAMKGHPGTGKSTIARGIASAVRAPLLDKDDIRDCTMALQQSLAEGSKGPALLNELSYTVLWQMARTQLELGLSVVVDSPLSRQAHLDDLVRLADSTGSRLIIVECRPGDEAMWRRRLERRAEGQGASWHKPATWRDLTRLVEGYRGCNEYDVGPVPKIVLDTTNGAKVDSLVEMVIKFAMSKRMQLN